MGGQVTNKYTTLAATLRKHPGRWAISPFQYASRDSAKQAALNVRRGKVKSMPKGEYEAVADDIKIYVRYVGD